MPKRDEQGAERCTTYGLCAVACETITMEAIERKKGKKLYTEKKNIPTVYEINMLRCIFCGFYLKKHVLKNHFLTDRIVPVSRIEHSDMIYSKDRLVKEINNPIDVTKHETYKMC